MILIADSGSTKCDWLLIDENYEFNFYYTCGFNPYFHTEEFIAHAISQNTKLSQIAPQITSVYYYGAGCSSEVLNLTVEKALKNVFKQAQVQVDHDLVAAAYATYNGEACISCILGTGSNSCYFDGHEIFEEAPALGYILGDEGSGSYFGKKFLSMYLYKQLPLHLENQFTDTYQITKDSIIDNVYRKPNANVYLASFMKFISQHKNDNFIREMVYEGMLLFLKNHVCSYKQYKDVPVHFVGSVAWHFQDVLYQAANDLGIHLGRIIQKPIEELAKYHLTKNAVPFSALA